MKRKISPVIDHFNVHGGGKMQSFLLLRAYTGLKIARLDDYQI
jgi:hypothetical protein